MLLAELEIFHTRPAVPTRRIALGHLVLPVDPAPGFGGLLLGAVIANHVADVGVELLADVNRLISQVEGGERIVQPRLRHRFQVDRHGLSSSQHRMVGTDGEVGFEFDTTGTPLAQVLGAIYAVERLAIDSRRIIAPVLRKATKWRGPIGPTLIGFLAGSNTADLSALADPRAWALEMLGFPADHGEPSRREVSRSYRARMRAVHPDHGGDRDDASKAILDLNEARRILGAK